LHSTHRGYWRAAGFYGKPDVIQRGLRYCYALVVGTVLDAGRYCYALVVGTVLDAGFQHDARSSQYDLASPSFSAERR
jgi:hypothetical protein